MCHLPSLRLALASALSLSPCLAAATDYTVGPGAGRDFASLSTLLAQVNLQPGDVVKVDGNTTYTASGSVGFRLDENDGGAPGNPVRIVGVPIAGKRPHLTMSSGDHVLKIERADHVVIEGFEISSGGGGAKSCLFSEADDVVLRDLLIHDCKAHGLLAADENSGSLTLEYSEIHHAGSGQLRHPIYVTADPVRYPAAVFRMQFNYVHDGNGGNLLKSRHRRNEIYYNWFEGAAYQEIELIGPDCEAWDGTPPDVQANSDLVGNVIIHTGSWSNAIRAGGDLNGRSRGLLRMVNNTLLIDRASSVNAVYVQLGLKGLEMHNNLIHQTGAKPVIVRENTSPDTPTCGYTDTRPWVDGTRRVHGGTNWITAGATSVPSASEWMMTFSGNDPRLAQLASRDLRPLLDSPLRGAANTLPSDAPGVPFPQPLPVPQFEPPLRAKLAPNTAVARVGNPGLSIGALEPLAPRRVHGAMPLLPGQAPPAAAPLPALSRSAPLRAAPAPTPRVAATRVAAQARPAAAPRCTPAPAARTSGWIETLAAMWQRVMQAPPSGCDDD